MLVQFYECHLGIEVLGLQSVLLNLAFDLVNLENNNTWFKIVVSVDLVLKSKFIKINVYELCNLWGLMSNSYLFRY